MRLAWGWQDMCGKLTCSSLSYAAWSPMEPPRGDLGRVARHLVLRAPVRDTSGTLSYPPLCSCRPRSARIGAYPGMGAPDTGVWCTAQRVGVAPVPCAPCCMRVVQPDHHVSLVGGDRSSMSHSPSARSRSSRPDAPRPRLRRRPPRLWALVLLGTVLARITNELESEPLRWSAGGSAWWSSVSGAACAFHRRAAGLSALARS
jgi:hypothetical protein